MPWRTLNCAIDFLARVTTGFWPVIARELVGAGVDDLGVAGRLAEAHVDDDLLDLRDRHHVRVAELLRERRHDFLAVAFLQAAHLSTTPSHLRQIRTLRPSPRILRPMRVGLPHSGHTICTFEACSGASRSTTPPLICFCGLGLRVALDDVHALDDDAVLRRQDLQHAAALAAILAGDDDHVVVLANGCC